MNHPMRIIVPIKQVPETSSVKMDEKTGTMIRDGVEAIINPLDLYAIELSIKIREKNGGEITVISMGPPKAVIALKEAIAMGADGGVLLSDKAFSGADTWATSKVLAAAVEKLGKFDLIICGERATDGDTGQVGPGIAAWLNIPVVSYVGSLDEITQDSCKLHRLVEDGHEVLEMPLPGLITVVKETGAPRLPTLSGKLRAKKAEVPVWSNTDLRLPQDQIGLNGSPTRVVKIFKPKIARKCRKELATNAAEIDSSTSGLISFLHARIVSEKPL